MDYELILVCGALVAWIFCALAMYFSILFTGAPHPLIVLILLFFSGFLIILSKKFFSENGVLSRSLKKSLKSCGIYKEFSGILVFPKIIIFDNCIEISIPDMWTRKKIEAYSDFFSSALPSGFLCDVSYFSKDEHFFIIEYSDTKKNSRLIYKNPLTLIKKLKTEPQNIIVLDKKIKFDFYKNYHLLISGGTGSGKSYAASLIVAELMAKNWEIYIFDIKRSFTIFQNFCDCSFSKNSILAKIDSLAELVRNRQELLESYISKNKNFNFILPSPVLILVEELTALLSVLDKKEKEKFLSVLSQIVLTGRQLNVHLIAVMQVSSADLFPSSIRANCCPMVLGASNETIQKTAFGLSAKTIKKKFLQGEGLICLDGITPKPVSIPTIKFPLISLLQAAAAPERKAAGASLNLTKDTETAGGDVHGHH